MDIFKSSTTHYCVTRLLGVTTMFLLFTEFEIFRVFNPLETSKLYVNIHICFRLFLTTTINEETFRIKFSSNSKAFA